MATNPKRIVLTYGDYLELPNDRNRYEILEGDLVVTPAPSTKHQSVLAELLFIVKQHVRRGALSGRSCPRRVTAC